MAINIPISWGELIDKITILEIKMNRIPDVEKLENIDKELQALRSSFNKGCSEPESIDKLKSELRAVNEKLWEIEDDHETGEGSAIYITNADRPGYCCKGIILHIRYHDRLSIYQSG